jgi:hypothetical protein
MAKIDNYSQIKEVKKKRFQNIIRKQLFPIDTYADFKMVVYLVVVLE